jgi:hypothetical protein
MKVSFRHASDFARPSIPGFLRIVGGRFDEVQRLVDELPMLPEAEILIVGEPDISVTMVDDVERPDLACGGFPPYSELHQR